MDLLYRLLLQHIHRVDVFGLFAHRLALRFDELDAVEESLHVEFLEIHQFVEFGDFFEFFLDVEG